MVKVKAVLLKVLHGDDLVLLGIFACWSAYVIIAGIVGIIMLQPMKMPGIDFTYGKFWDLWAHWDGWHYINISANGYSIPQLAAFFPLYPMSVHFVSKILTINPVAAGFIVSHVALFGAVCFIFRLIRDISSREIAYTSILLLLFFPSSLFFSMVYTESLFLFLASGTMFFAYKKRWFFAFIFSFFAALTRNLGVLLLFPLIVEYITQYGFRFKKTVFALIGPILGMASYMAFLYKTFGNPLQFVNAQASWNRHIVLNPFAIIYDKLAKIILSIEHRDIFMGVEILAGFSFLAIIVMSLQKKYRMSYSLITYMVVMLLPGLLQNTWASVNRYVVVIFPAFFLMALILEKKPLLQRMVLAGFSIFLGVGTVLFVNFRWAG